VIDDPSKDSRWLRLNQRDWTCPCCGLKHAGLFDLVVPKPDYWLGADRRDNREILGANNIWTEDFCVINGDDYFLRAVLTLPIKGIADAQFAYGVWTTLSKANFDLYVRTFDSGMQGHLGPWFGWLSNRLAGYPETLSLKCSVQPRDDRRRPAITLEPTEHPLSLEQRDGITLDRLFEIYALNGHDFRSALI
jgi:hypothetical protein